MTITPTTSTPTAPQPQPTAPTPPAPRNDHDADDAPGAVRPAVEKGVGERLDKTA